MGSAIAWLLGFFSFTDVVFAIACFFLLSLRRLFKKEELLVNWPLVGMLPSLLLNVHRHHDWYTQVLRGNSCTVLFKGPWLSGMKMLVTCDPRNVAHVLGTAHFSNYPKGQDYTEIFDILGDGILNTDYGSWKVQRKMGHTHIRNRRFRQFVVKASRDMVEKGLLPILQTAARETKAMDLQDVMKRFTFDATCILVCGVDPGCLSSCYPIVPFAKAVDDANEVVVLRHAVPRFCWKMLKRLNMGPEKKLADAWETIDRFIAKQISTRKEELQRAKLPNSEEEEEEAIDLLTLYMQHENGEEMGQLKSPTTFLRDTTLNMLAAGRDATSAALTWFFWLLSEHPSAEAKILEELKSIPIPTPTPTPTNKGEKPRVFSSEELSGSVYLYAALCESMRLFAPVPMVHKGVVSPDVLPSGHRVEPGMKILYSLFAMGRMEMVWGKDCLEFRPERWISEQGTLRSDHSDKFMVFNMGPRSCLGKDISFTQMKVVAAAVVYNFQVEVVKGQNITPKLGVTLHMKKGLLVKVRGRSVTN